MKTVRGAISIEKDDAEFLDKAVVDLFSAFLHQSAEFFKKTDAVIFSVTDDIMCKNPAKALREHFSEAAGISLMVVKEAYFRDSAEMMIRVLIFYEGSGLVPVYLGRAAILRPDLAGSDE